MTTDAVFQRGIVYSATGERFVGEAINSAKSSLRFNKVPHFIFCDVEPGEPIEGVTFSRFAPCGNPLLDRIRNICQAPFKRVIYLDTDTYVIDNIEELFDLLERFDVAVAHAPGYVKCDDNGQSEAFNDFNAGVIVFRKSPGVHALLAHWRDIYESWTKTPPFNLQGKEDQPALRRALWESSVSLYVLGPEYNYRSVFPGRLIGRAKIIHGRSTNYEKLAAYVNAVIEPRVFKRFPPDWIW